eukprot:8187906-Pyramimonas_sp.AAC.1
MRGEGGGRGFALGRGGGICAGTGMPSITRQTRGAGRRMDEGDLNEDKWRREAVAAGGRKGKEGGGPGS